jgi:hypothetical protein
MKCLVQIELPTTDRSDTHRLSAILLRDVADRLDQDMSFGGFHFSKAVSFPGNYLVGDFSWSKVGSSRPEPEPEPETVDITTLIKAFEDSREAAYVLRYTMPHQGTIEVSLSSLTAVEAYLGSRPGVVQAVGDTIQVFKQLDVTKLLERVG